MKVISHFAPNGNETIGSQQEGEEMVTYLGFSKRYETNQKQKSQEQFGSPIQYKLSACYYST